MVLNAAVLAQISNLDAPRSLSYISNFHLPGSSSHADAKSLHVLEGLWWLYNSNTHLLLSIIIPSEQPRSVKLSLRSRPDQNPEEHWLEVSRMARFVCHCAPCFLGRYSHSFCQCFTRT